MTAVNAVSGNTNVLKLSPQLSSEPLVVFGGKKTIWNLGWYRCIELRIIWKKKCNYNKQYRSNIIILTCPLSSNWLFVNFSLSKDTVCFIHCAPVAGLSGCTCILGGETGSALPATTQLELDITNIINSTKTGSLVLLFAMNCRQQTTTWNVSLTSNEVHTCLKA